MISFQTIRESQFWRVGKKLYELRVVRKWVRNGRPIPVPGPVKTRKLLEMKRRFGLRIFVESGTYKGEMVEEMIPFFDRIYSIELDEILYRGAADRFRSFPKVEIIHGDSGKVLGEILDHIDRPALFWLDGHFSGPGTAQSGKDTPIIDELAHITRHPIKNHVILIDDLHCFTGKNGYPDMEGLGQLLQSQFPHHKLELQNNMALITPES